MATVARRKTDRGEQDYRAMRTDSSVTWKWLAVAAFGILVTAGGSWLAYVQSQITGVVVAANEDRKQGAKDAAESARTQEKVNNIEKKVDGVDKKVDELRGDLKELLRNQQQQIYQQQGAPKR